MLQFQYQYSALQEHSGGGKTKQTKALKIKTLRNDPATFSSQEQFSNHQAPDAPSVQALITHEQLVRIYYCIGGGNLNK